MEENKNVVNTSTTEKEGSKFGWGVLGFFFPLVGLILFLVWMKDKKKASKAAGIGALIGFLVNVLLTTLSLMGIVSISTLAGEPVLNVKTNTKTVEKKKENKETTKKDETKKDETKKEETKNTNESTKADPNDACSVKATAGDKAYLYNFDYSDSCETTNVIDDSNNVLFKIKNNQLVLNNGQEFDTYDKSFYNTGNSIIVYSSFCSPGLCYVYINNLKDNTGFKIDSSIENGKMINPYIRAIGINRENKLNVNIMHNESASMESVSNDPKAIVIMKIRACEVSDIDSVLNEYNLDNFAMKKNYAYKIEDGTINSNPKEEVTQTIKDYYEYVKYSICNR